MKAALLFGSTRGSTRRVVQRCQRLLEFDVTVYDVKQLQEYSVVRDFRLLLLFAPTYGDEELQDDMERFLVGCKEDLAGTFYAACELGNYYGYDDFSYGAMPIMRTRMEQLGAREFVPPLSMDSLPKKDWLSLERWCHILNARHSDAR